MWEEIFAKTICYYPKHTKYLLLINRKKKKTASREEQRTWTGNLQNKNLKWPEIQKISQSYCWPRTHGVKNNEILVFLYFRLAKILKGWL